MSGRTRITVTPFRRIIRGASGLAQSVIGLGLAPESVIAERTTICGDCPKRRGPSCGLCGCAVKHKVRLAAQRCPDNPPRWCAYTPPQEAVP